MSWLLKVVEGPAKGAEIALVDGMRVKVGSAPSCDIVLGDISLAAEAFELDVTEGVVTLISPDGTQSQMKPLEIRDFGTTAVAIGPSDEPWGELVRPAPEAEEPHPDPDEAAPASEAEPPPEDDGKGKGAAPFIWAAVAALVLVVLAALLFLFFRGCRRDASAEASAAAAPAVASLADIAAQHGLSIEVRDGARTLAGHLHRRTERLAIRALALAAEPGCRFALTDDETMLKASEELLFAYTDGALRAVAASNRVVFLAGHVERAAALERAIRTLDAEVKGIERVETSGVTVGGPAPVRPPAERPVASFAGTPVPEPPARKPEAKKPRINRSIAGILTTPYPCVIMGDGHRVMEGAQIGTATLERIEPDRLVFRDGASTFEWRP